MANNIHQNTNEYDQDKYDQDDYEFPGQHSGMQWNEAGMVRQQLKNSVWLHPGRLKAVQRIRDIAGLGLAVVEQAFQAGLQMMKTPRSIAHVTPDMRHLKKPELNQKAAVSEWQAMTLIFRTIRGAMVKQILGRDANSFSSATFGGPHRAALEQIENEVELAMAGLEAAGYSKSRMRNRNAYVPLFLVSSVKGASWNFNMAVESVDAAASTYWVPSKSAKKAMKSQERELVGLVRDLDKLADSPTVEEGNPDNDEYAFASPDILPKGGKCIPSIFVERFQESDVDLRGWQALPLLLESDVPWDFASPGPIVQAIAHETGAALALSAWTATLNMLGDIEQFRTILRKAGSSFKRPLSTYKFFADCILVCLANYFKNSPKLAKILFHDLPIIKSNVPELLDQINRDPAWINTKRTYLWQGQHPKFQATGSEWFPRS